MAFSSAPPYSSPEEEPQRGDFSAQDAKAPVERPEAVMNIEIKPGISGIRPAVLLGAMAVGILMWIGLGLLVFGLVRLLTG